MAVYSHVQLYVLSNARIKGIGEGRLVFISNLVKTKTILSCVFLPKIVGPNIIRGWCVQKVRSICFAVFSCICLNIFVTAAYAEPLRPHDKTPGVNLEQKSKRAIINENEPNNLDQPASNKPASVFESPPPGSSSDKSSIYNQRNDRGAKTYVDGSFWTAKLTDWIAVFLTIGAIAFNYLLWCSTEKLWKTGESQLKLASDNAKSQSIDMQASLEIAREVAKAAKLQAEAAIGVELPRFQLESVQLHGKGEIEIRDKINPLGFKIIIRNLGRTPAYVTSHCLEVLMLPKLPDKPNYDRFKDLPSDTVIKPGDVHVIEENHPGQLKIKKVDEFMDDQISIWVYGYVEYTDFMKQVRQFRFARQLSINRHSDDGFMLGEPERPEYTAGY